jgi:hypothetical protein
MGQALPHAPQLLALVKVSTHAAPPHVVLHVQLPFTQTSPGVVASHAWSVAGSSSTIPSQSLSLPSHASGEGVHWHTVVELVLPTGVAHVHPVTQSATV